MIIRKALFFVVLALSVLFWDACAGRFRNTGEPEEVIFERAAALARPYASVALLEEINADGAFHGTAFLVGRKDREIWLLTAKHCVMKNEKFLSLELTFTLENGHQIKCFPLSCFLPKDSPKTIESEELKNDDIALLRCFLPISEPFDISPLLMVPSTQEDSFLTHYEGYFVGHGRYGINSGSLKRDLTRRLGETYLVECRKKEMWGVVSFVPGKKGTAKKQTDEFTESKKEFQMEGITIKGEPLSGRLHPRQAIIQSGDSGSPLIIKKEEGEEVIGIVSKSDIKITEQVGWFVFKEIYNHFIPLRYYREWVKEVIEGDRTGEHLLMPRLYEGYLKGPALEITTKKSIHAFISFGLGTYFFEKYEPTPNIFLNNSSQLTLVVEENQLDCSRYNSPEEAVQGLLSSGLFESVEFKKNGEIPMDLLFPKFIEACDIFLERLDLYTEAQIAQGFEMVRARYTELKEKGLDDALLPERILGVLHSAR
jgi:hypothetical protein